MPRPNETSPISSQGTRREFMQKTGVAVVGGALAGSLAAPQAVHAAGSDTLKVALIGCGGRGSGAAVNAMNADKNAQLTVMADLFPDRLEISKNVLRSKLGTQFAVKDEQCFTGFDAYKQVMKTDVDVVLLCTPPHFRPLQLAAAVEAGKHIFCEKPVAVDGPGCRSVLEAAEKARQKNLSLVSGLCWRYDWGVRETMKRIKDGAIGDIVAIQENYLTGTLWHREREPQMSEMEFQCRNWLYYTWLSGDHIVEQHIHSLDKAVWLMDDQLPERCFGLGGRQVRVDPKFGHIYDHHAVCYEFPGGVKTFAYTRQMDNCYRDVDDYVMGTKGSARLLKFTIEGENPWRYRGEKPSMYDAEHVELFASIRAGKPINNGDYMTKSTLMAIMGRDACYSGQSITSEEALNSTVSLGPKKYEFGDAPQMSVPLPGFGDLSKVGG